MSDRHTPETGEALHMMKGAEYVDQLFTSFPEPKKTRLRLQWLKGKIRAREKMGRERKDLVELHSAYQKRRRELESKQAA